MMGDVDRLVALDPAEDAGILGFDSFSTHAAGHHAAPTVSEQIDVFLRLTPYLMPCSPRRVRVFANQTHREKQDHHGRDPYEGIYDS